MLIGGGYNKSWARNVKKTKIGDELYDSKFEASYAQELMLRKAAREITSFIPHPKLELIVNGFKICTYTPDFLVFYPDGTKEYVETKGFPDKRFKIVWKIFYALYSEQPDTKLLLVQQSWYKVMNPKKVKEEVNGK